MAWALLAGLLSAAAAADAKPKAPAPGVCPLRAGAWPSQIDVFDGDPAEQVQLAPDDEQARVGTYQVDGVYAQGRTVTIRCQFGPQAVDVKLTKPVKRCRDSGDAPHAQIVCR